MSMTRYIGSNQIQRNSFRSSRGTENGDGGEFDRQLAAFVNVLTITANSQTDRAGVA